MFSLKGVLFPLILAIVAFFGLFFLPICLVLYLLPFCGKLARTANDLLISSWLKLVPVSAWYKIRSYVYSILFSFHISKALFGKSCI